MSSGLMLLLITCAVVYPKILIPYLGTSDLNQGLKSIYEDITKLKMRSIVLLYEENEDYADFLKRLYELLVPTYTIPLYESGIDKIYSSKHEICYDNLKLFIIYQMCLNQGTVNRTLHYMTGLKFWKNRQKVVFVTETTSTELFDACFKKWVLNVVLVPVKELSGVQVFTPYEKNITKTQKSLVFPNHFLNLNGFVINISLFEETAHARVNGRYYTGRDGEIARAIVEKINASFNYLDAQDGDTFGYLNISFTSGVARDVILNVTQAAFNSRVIVDGYKKAEFTYCHDRDDLVALVPKNKETKTLFEIIPTLLWPVVAVITLLMLTFLVLTTKNTYCEIFLMLTLILTSHSLRESSVKRFRVAYMSVMVIVIFISIIICCSLSSYSTVPQYEKEITTVKELMQTDYKIAINDMFRSILNRTLDAEVLQNLIPRTETISVKEQAEEALKCKKRAVIIKNGLAKLVLSRGGSRCYIELKQHIFPSSVGYIVGYGSPFLPRFNIIIRRLVESGLHKFWKPHFLDEEEEEQYIRITFRFLRSTFVVYVVGVVLGVVVFVGEIALQRFRQKGLPKA